MSEIQALTPEGTQHLIQKVKTEKEDVFRLSTMPTASAENVGRIVQFIGTTSGGYTHGYFYECKENSGSYSWQQTDVQPNGGGIGLPSGGTTGQVLKKKSNTDYDVEWGEGGGGGTTIVQKPTVVVGTYTYDGTAQGPTITWATGMADKCIVTNATKTDAGTYTLTIALKNTSTMVWNDLTTADLTYEYTIGKATPTFTVSPSSVTLDPEHTSATLTYSYDGDGTVSVTTESTYITITGSGNTRTISATEGGGYSTVIFSAIAGDNYIAAADAVCTVTLDFLPDGKTVTPINDVSILIRCAGIFGSSITTMSGLLADSTTLLAVMSSNNAVDYLVRSTGFASDICANSTAMTDIGANNYCADTLLDDSTWLNAICNSAYFESVLNVKVPTMTSNTAPYGKVSVNSAYGTNQGYHAFDGNSETYWMCGNLANPSQSATGWISYGFTNPTKVKSFKIVNAYYPITSISIKGSNDGTNWSEAIWSKTYSVSQAIKTIEESFDNSNYYLYYKVDLTSYNTSSSSGVGVIQLFKLQFYGRASS